MPINFRSALVQSPVIAVLRHLSPEEAPGVADALINAGVTLLEIPMNGRDAFAALDVMVRHCGECALVGAATAITPEEVARAADIGATFILSPHLDADVVKATLSHGLISIPGVATPSEAFAALKYGAHALKAFPGEGLPPAVLKSWRTVLPPGTLVIASGGVNADNVQDYIAAGVDGFGVASAVFAPGLPPEEIKAKAERLMRAIRGS